MMGLSLVFFVVVFFLLGAIANGLTIAVIGLLMEISPEEARPQYSGYFNALTAPAFLLPLMAGGVVHAAGTSVVFGLSLGAAALQVYFVARLPRPEMALR
jgi:MFS family permease